MFLRHGEVFILMREQFTKLKPFIISNLIAADDLTPSASASICLYIYLTDKVRLPDTTAYTKWDSFTSYCLSQSSGNYFF